MFSNEILAQVCTRMRVNETELKILLAYGDSSLRHSKWNLQGQLVNGDFKAATGENVYSVKFLRRNHDLKNRNEIEFAFLIEAIVAIESSTYLRGCAPMFYKLFEVPFQLKTKDISRSIMTVSEFCLHGPLSSVLMHLSKHLDDIHNDDDLWTRAISLCQSICEAIYFLHGELHIIHGSINAQHFLITEDWTARICGFQNAYRCEASYTAQLGRDDMYDVGILLTEIITSFDSRSEGEGGVPDILQRLARLCCSNENERPTADECVRYYEGPLSALSSPYIALPPLVIPFKHSLTNKQVLHRLDCTTASLPPATHESSPPLSSVAPPIVRQDDSSVALDDLRKKLDIILGKISNIESALCLDDFSPNTPSFAVAAPAQAPIQPEFSSSPSATTAVTNLTDAESVSGSMLDAGILEPVVASDEARMSLASSLEGFLCQMDRMHNLLREKTTKAAKARLLASSADAAARPFTSPRKRSLEERITPTPMWSTMS